MTYLEALEALDKMIHEARSVPLSASAVIPRAEAIKLLEAIKDGLPREHQQAREILGERERVLSEANDRAAHIVQQAREERARLLSSSDLVQGAEREAHRIMEEAQAEADRLATQADDYADAKLANMEILLEKLVRTIGRGREQLRRRLDAARPEVAPLDLEDSGEVLGPIPDTESPE